MAFWLTLFATASLSGQPLELREGDTIVLVGDTHIEREQRYGYFETALLAAHPRLKLRIRNLGWSGDSVRGLSRAYFDPPEKGRERLIEQVKAEKPTVLIVGFGMADSFAGPEGVDAFRRDYDALLDQISGGARSVVLLSPIRSIRNAAVSPYRDAIARLAAQRRLRFVDQTGSGDADLDGALFDARTGVYVNGIHLTEVGYWVWARTLLRELFAIEDRITVDASGVDAARRSPGIAEFERSADSIRFTIEVPLPTPVPPGASDWTPLWGPDAGRPQSAFPHLVVSGLPPGRYRCRMDDRLIATATHEELAAGIPLRNTPMHAAAEALRQAVIRKNRLFFDRYRPQNITYLLGFRQYEQGQNAKELDELDRLVRLAEGEIDKLRLPRRYRFAMTRD